MFGHSSDEVEKETQPTLSTMAAPEPSDNVTDADATPAKEAGDAVEAAKTTESPDSSSDEVEVIPADVPAGRKRKTAQHRRNIKEILGQDKLDERTLAAQREEWARRERMAAKLQNLGKNTKLPLSMEQIMERFSNKSLVSMTPVAEAELHESRGTLPQNTVPAKKTAYVEHEVLTLSSDDEECVPVPSTKDYSVRSAQPPPYSYGSFVSDSSRSRYSGGTMIVPSPNSDLKDISTFGEEVESRKDIVEDDDSDDCVVLSPGVVEDEEEKDEDELNVPDELGRILINVGHPPEDPDIFLAPQIAKTIKPHQVCLNTITYSWMYYNFF